jgi:hypothetical protein
MYGEVPVRQGCGLPPALLWKLFHTRWPERLTHWQYGPWVGGCLSENKLWRVCKISYFIYKKVQLLLGNTNPGLFIELKNTCMNLVESRKLLSLHQMNPVKYISKCTISNLLGFVHFLGCIITLDPHWTYQNLVI